MTLAYAPSAIASPRKPAVLMYFNSVNFEQIGSMSPLDFFQVLVAVVLKCLT